MDGRRPPASPAAGSAGSAVGGRLLEGSGPQLIHSAHRLELQSAGALLPAMILADIAHILVLLDHDLVPREPGRQLLAALLELRTAGLAGTPSGAGEQAPVDALIPDPALGDLPMNREAWLRARVGVAAGYLLVGRPRREAVTVAFHLAMRDRVLALASALERLQRSLVDLAAGHLRTLAVDYTYWQPAQATTLAHSLLAYAYPLGREVERLRAVFGRTNVSPAGAGCTNGAGIPIDRARLARLLGFDGVVLHTRDANWQPDLALELTWIAASTGLALDRLAEDLQIWTTREFGFVELADRAARASLAMPQKKNPYALIFVRGAATRLLGRLAGAGALAKAASGQPDQRIFAQDEVPAALELAEQSAALLVEVLAGVRFDRDRLAAAARRGYLAGNDLAERIMYSSGLSFGEAHRIVGAAVRRALEAGRDTDGIDAASLDAAALEVHGAPLGLSDGDVRDALDPEAAVSRRTGIGGAAPASVRGLLAERRRALRRQRRWVDARRAAIDRATAALVACAHEAVAS
ncbi:MAG: lyase family protein [Candidatus Limnocylindrales bacterium]|nr:lyase family protein [Candidatus Limnocylindrales bacterium]